MGPLRVSGLNVPRRTDGSPSARTSRRRDHRRRPLAIRIDARWHMPFACMPPLACRPGPPAERTHVIVCSTTSYVMWYCRQKGWGVLRAGWADHHAARTGFGAPGAGAGGAPSAIWCVHGQ